MTDEQKTRTCFGCGAKLRHGLYDNNYATFGGLKGPDGHELEVCSGRSHRPKRACLRKALMRLVGEVDVEGYYSAPRYCLLCGQEHEDHAHVICKPCREAYNYGLARKDKDKKAFEDIQRDAITAVLVSTLNYSMNGRWRGKLRSEWPFTLHPEFKEQAAKVKPVSGRQSSAAVALHAMRMAWRSMIEASRHQGFLEGSHLLRNLREGKVGLGEFDKERAEVEEKVPRSIEELNEWLGKLVAEVQKTMREGGE
jgi:hypothetical protein